MPSKPTHLGSGRHALRILTLVATSLALCHCTPLSTPQSRIAEYPERFGALSDRDQELAANGEVREGMPRDAVFIAWGKPGRIQEGSRSGTATETWVYLGRYPVQSYNTSFGYGGYWGRGGYRYGGSPYWGSVGRESFVQYVPYVRATATFASDRVVAWERMR